MFGFPVLFNFLSTGTLVVWLPYSYVQYMTMMISLNVLKYILLVITLTLLRQ